MTGKNATEPLFADAAGIAHAARLLRKDGLVAVPTETVYGLAARADSDEAVAKIYAAKGRPSFNPLIVHVGAVDQAQALAHFDERAQMLADRFWPGPLTLVLPLREDARVARAVTAGLETIAIRMPEHPVMRALLEECGFPLAAPSANRSEAISPTSTGHVLATLEGRIDAVIDGGECARGLESTIVALRDNGGWQLLRAGPIEEREIAGLLGPALGEAKGIEAPGQLARHYSPGKPVRLDAEAAEADEFHIGFAEIAGDVSLSHAGELAEAASKLYAALHKAAKSDKPRIAVAPIPERGVGIAINDRLRRAAA